MDIDVFVARHEKTWNRLEILVDKRKLTGRQCDELVALYQVSSAHLSYIQSNFSDDDVVLYLSRILSKANTRIASSSKSNMKNIKEFFVKSLPATLYELRYWTISSMFIFISLAVIEFFWITYTPGVLEALGSPEELDRYANIEFVKYYTNYGAADFTTQVWTNNAFIAAKMVALGITGIGPLYVLYENAIGIGIAAAVLYEYSSLGSFFKLILPHGLLELTAIFIACGAGTKLFWALLVPTNESRSVSVAKQGRSTVIVALGLIFILLVAGLIEGFITGSNLPSWLKILIGVISLVALWIYTLVIGKRSYNTYNKADISESEVGYTDIENG